MLESGPRNAVLAGRAKRHGAVQKMRELAALCRFLRDREIQTVIEIGTERGGTFWLWSKLARPDARLIAVDIADPLRPWQPGPDQLHARSSQWVALVRGDSHQPETLRRVEELLGTRRADLLFIDGDHSYEGARQDFGMYGSLVRKGGVVVFHDILEHPPEANSHVDRLWGELLAHHTTREFVDAGDLKQGRLWGGLGALLL